MSRLCEEPKATKQSRTAVATHHPLDCFAFGSQRRRGGDLTLTHSPPSDALERVRDRIAAAAVRAGRDPADVTLIAVGKRHPASALAALMEAGQLVFGENRVDEAEDKVPDLRAVEPRLRLHLVGRLQSNKAAAAAELFDAIHSLDRPSLVRALARCPRVPDCFVQVNIGGEPQKGGCAIAALPDMLDHARAAGLPVVGLMSVPPLEGDPAPYFALTAELAARHGLTGLSMGMSGDFETAVALGATHVRVGTALFGARA